LKRGIVLFAHGARDPDWALPVNRLAELVASRDHGVSVAAAYLEHMPPPLEDAVASMVQSGVADITVVPVFIAQGGHLKQDLPRIVDAIRDTHPNLVIRLAPPMGESSAVLEAMAAFASAASSGKAGTGSAA
jgi:sirohydrochlorin cobaltochelatase